MNETTMTDDHARDALEDQVRMFVNEHIGQTMTPDEWERDFRRWQERRPLREVYAEAMRFMSGE